MSTESTHICIASNFTIEPIEEFLAYWLTELGVRADIRFAPYNQVFQQLLEGGLLRSNRGGINLVALDLDAWLIPGPVEAARLQLEQAVADFVAALRAAGLFGAGGAVLLFPPSAGRDEARTSALAAARASLLAQCSSTDLWSAVDLTPTAALYSVVETRDPFTDELGNIPFTEEMYAAAATAAARSIRASSGRPRKVIVLDCDNTLWHGLCGEGPQQVTPPYRRLQEFMLRQRENGMLLALASRNNEVDVMAALQTEDCVLRPEHFTAWRINWSPKSENLKVLSEELGLELRSFIVLDDSSFECMEIRNQCPEVLAIELPTDPEAIPAFLAHLWIFDHRAATEEDRRRASLYQAEQQRNELSRRAPTQEEFLASLEVEIQLAPATQSEFARVAQLTQRTTQFNLTGVRHTEQTLSALLAQGRHECWTVRVRDLFGDYGLVGVLLFETGDGVHVNSFLLSCRALGRRVEDGMADHLRRRARELGAEEVIFPVVPTARNRPALEFLNRICGSSENTQEPFECVMSTAGDSAGRRAPAHSAPPALRGPAVRMPSRRDAEDSTLRFAHKLRTAEAVITAARMTIKRRPLTADPLVPPRNLIEERLVRIWADCLGIEPVGVRDNFLDFGGHSLVATRILARARTEFGAELSLTTFFQAPTVEGMAMCIASPLHGEKVASVGAS